MNNEQIDVMIACGTNAEAYVEFLLWSIRQTARAPDRFRYILGVNQPDVNVTRLKALTSQANIKIVDASSGKGYCSDSHGIALNKIFSHVESNLSMIMDSDIAWIEPDWDELLVGMMEEHDIVGTEYRSVWPDSSGRKYQDWPNGIGCLMKTEVIRATQVNFRPASTITLDAQNAYHYGLPVGTLCHRDTAYQLSEKLRINGSTGIPLKIFNAASQNSKFMKVPFSIRGDEYQHEDIPLLTHLGRSSSRRFGEHPLAIAWESRVREWINTHGN